MTSQNKIVIFYVAFCVCKFLVLSDNALNELCLNCLDNVSIGGCNCLFCQSNSSCDNKIDLSKYNIALSDPTLACRDESSLTFKWGLRKTMFYFIQYFIGRSNESKYTNITKSNHMTINGLHANANYSVYLFGFNFDEKTLYRSNKIMSKTSKIFTNRTPVKNLNYTLSLHENIYTAIVEWEPGFDLSCFYEVVWYGKRAPGEYIHRRVSLKKYLKHEFNLTHLDFGEIYHFSILSVDSNGFSESPKKTLKIPTPSCLKTYKNLTICPPNPPRNLTVTELPSTSKDGFGSNLKLNWNLPSLKPTYYAVSFFSSNGSSNNAYNFNVNISGDREFAVLRNLTLGKYYQVKLVAYSKGGASAPAYIVHYPSDNVNKSSPKSVDDNVTKKTPSGKFISWMWIMVATAIAMFVIFLLYHYFKNFIYNCLFVKEKLDDTIVRYTTSETEDSKWELTESKLLVDKVIGFGAFGIVQKGYYYLDLDKKTEVAVKTLKAKPTGEQIAQFYDEIEIMKSVPRHSHIVYLIGVVTKHRPSNPLMLVEYCSRGDLQSYLRKIAFILADSHTNEEPNNSLDYSEDGTRFFNKSYALDTSVSTENHYVLESKDLLSFARQIVLGMEFLSNLKIVHRDLAARNVLISENNTLKISDFGLSRDIYTDNMYKKVTGGKLPFRWMAIESLTHQIYTTESDVWSFGIVLWEIVTLGGNPYPAVNTQDLVPLLKNGYRMEKPINCSEEVYQIMLNCWHMSPNLRYCFKELREIFDKLLESEMQYISLEDSKKIDQNLYENIKTEQERYIL